MNWRRLRYVLPSNRRREELEMQKELESLRALAEPRELGNLTLAAENVRQTWHFTSFTGITADIRYALRTLPRQPLFLAVAVLSVAIGVGANGALFSFVDAQLFRPLPLPRPSELRWLWASTPDNPVDGLSYPDYRDLLERSRSFAGLVACKAADVRVAPDVMSAPRVRTAAMVSDNFFTVLDTVPPLGRTFLPEEGRSSRARPEVVLAHEFWAREYSRDPSIVGRMLRINRIDFTIVGVAPESFSSMGPGFSRRPQIFLPLSMSQLLDGAPGDPLQERSRHDLVVAGRLRTGVSQDSAQAELLAIASNPERTPPTTNRNYRIVMRTELGSRIALDTEMVVFSTTALGLAALLLFVACFNVAGLLLARAHGRMHEIAIRLAIGAGRLRLVRQLMTESLVIALLGGAAGLGLGHLGIRFLSRVAGVADDGLPMELGTGLDSRVVLFSLAAALASCLVFGLVPALQATQTRLVPAIKTGTEPFRVRRGTIGRDLLVIVQIVVTVVLLVLGGSMVEGLRRRLVAGPGFRTDHVIVLRTDPSSLRYSAERTRQLYRTLVERAHALPGVGSIALADNVPFDLTSFTLVPEGYRVPQGRDGVRIQGVVCDEHYLSLLKLPVVRGRSFTGADRPGAPAVAIVNEEFARRFWPGRSGVGKRIRLERADGPDLEVVGIAKAPFRHDFIAPATPAIFLPYEQNVRPTMALLLEHQGEAASLAATLRNLVHALDTDLPIADARALTSYEEQAARAWGTIVEWMAGMGLVALILAVLGLYARICYSVSRRTAEIGLRMAIGSTRAGVLRLVVQEGVTMAGATVIVTSALLGIMHVALARSAAGPTVETLIPLNGPTYALVPPGVLVICAAAAYVAARRAATIDPLQALRHE